MAENKHTLSDLYQMQSLSLDSKISMTRQRIRGWIDEFGEDGVYVSFSGGKDSTVLLDIVRKDYPDIEAVFVNTGLEYPSVRNFALSKENVIELRPEMNFRDVIIKYGYPIISKEVSNVVDEARRLKDGKTKTIRMMRLNGELLDHEGNKSRFNCEAYKFLLDAPFNISDKCCNIMKKKPFKLYEKRNSKRPIIGQMAEESRKRTQGWMHSGCNGFNLKRPQSNPMAFWTEQDVLTYIHTYIHTNSLLRKHTVKWLLKMMGLRGRLTFMTILTIIGIVDMKQLDARERGAFSADLASRKKNRGL